MTLNVLINGEMTNAVSVHDRGLMYGDGVFRTLRIRAGKPVWWREHLARLARDSASLSLPAAPPEVWQADLARLIPVDAEAVLKLIVTRGSGPRGYGPEPNATGSRIAILDTVPSYDKEWGKLGVRVRVCRLRLGHQPALAGIKHLNRLENVLARAEWDDPEIAEGLLMDEDGFLVSGTKSNVFLVRDGVLFTPALDRCGVAGVTRDRVLSIARASCIPVAEPCRLTLDDVMRADEVLLSNSLIGLWRVRRLGDRGWDTPVLHSRLAEQLVA